MKSQQGTVLLEEFGQITETTLQMRDKIHVMFFILCHKVGITSFSTGVSPVCFAHMYPGRQTNTSDNTSDFLVQFFANLFMPFALRISGRNDSKGTRLRCPRGILDLGLMIPLSNQCVLAARTSRLAGRA